MGQTDIVIGTFIIYLGDRRVGRRPSNNRRRLGSILTHHLNEIPW